MFLLIYSFFHLFTVKVLPEEVPPEVVTFTYCLPYEALGTFTVILVSLQE